MNKGPTTSVTKTSAPLPRQSAWAKGPPQATPTSSASSPRPQSPAPVAPQAQSQSHSRRSSQLGSFKDAVGVGIASGTRGNVPPTKSNPINFGTVNGAVNEKAGTTPSSSPAPAPPLTKSESRPVQSFGSIEATQSGMSTSSKPSPTPTSSSSSAAPATSSATTTANSTRATTPQKPSKVDVSAFFRGGSGGGGGGGKTSSPVNASFPPESVASPPMRSSTLSPAVPPPQSQNGPGPAGPGPHHHVHPHQQPPQSYPQPFVPAAMRNQNIGNGPRSPSFQRAMPNGAGGRPPGGGGPPGANGNNMPSPRLAPPPHMQHQHQQQPPPVQGMPPQMPGMPGWPSYYYPYMPSMPMQGVPGAEHYMQYPPQAWHMHPPPQHQLPHQGPSGANGPSQTPLTHSHGLPMSSPRQPPPPLQAPATPPAGISTPLPSAGPGGRLNTNANAFVPSQAGQPSVQRSKVKITDPQGHELDLHGLTKQSGTPISSTTPAPPTPASDKNVPRSVRIESPEVRSKRLAQEERERKAKEELERKKREEKEAEEQKKREQKEAEERKRREDEEKRKAEEEEKVRIEEERKQKEEERRRKEEEEKERVKLEEEERKRKEEEMRLRKEEDERERLRMEEEERRRKEEEEERQRKEAEEKERLQKEEEEAKAKAAAETAAAAEAEKAKAAPLEIKSRKEGEVASSVTGVPLSTSPETAKKRPIPGPLDLSSTHKSVAQPLPSALATARHIQDVYQVQYPEGIQSPKLELNTNAKDGKFRYDRDFLLQFMSVCKEKPDNLPSLEAIGLEPVDQSHPIGRGGSGRRGVSGSMGPPSSTSRQASVGLGLGLSNGFGGKTGSGFAMGNFATSNKLSSDERFMRSSSMSGGPGGMPYGAGRPAPMVRSSSQGGPGARGSGRTRSKRGDSTRNESNRVNAASSQFNSNMTIPLEPVAPLEQSANRWVAGTFKRGSQVDMDSPEVVDKKVRSLLNKLTMEKFESISNQIIEWANKSEREKDGRTLIQVIRLVFEKATDEAAWSEMYARLCRKMMEQISPNVQDDGIRNAEGKPITGGLLFRKYLLNRCQEDFERGWSQKESTAAAALVKATEDQAIQAANEKKEAGEVDTFSEEYYAAQKAKRQGLGLIKFIGELFKLQMLTERIMHECIKKLLSNVDNPEEEEIESLCKLLSTVGQALDTSKARGHMDVYFSRMTELARSSNVSSRMQFMLQDVIELRARKWIPRNAAAAPSTIAQIHEAAAKEKAQQDQHNLARTAISRGGSRRGHDRDGNAQVGPDGWAVASGPSRPANKAGDLTNFGKIQKGSGGLNFGPASVFTKKGDNKRDSASLSRASSSTNMFQMLQGAEAAGESLPVSSNRPSRPSSRTTSVDLTNSALSEPLQPAQRPRLNLLPRSKPLATDKSEASPAEGQEDEEGEEGEIVEKDYGKSSMSKEQAEKKVDQDRKEFFAIRDLEEAEEYFSALPSEHRHILVEKLVMSALEAKEADAKLVADLFERAISRNLCSPAAFEEGFMPAADVLDDVAIDAPKAFNLMAMMMKGAKLDEERRTRIANKSMDSDKLLGLLS